MIPPSTITRLASLGLSQAQAAAVAEMLSEVEAATEAKCASAIEARRANDRARKERQRHGTSRDVTGQDGTKTPQNEPSRTYARVLCSEEVSIYPPIEPTVLSPIPEKPKRAKPRRQIADDAQPTQRDRAYADEGGLSSDEFRSEWRKFRNHHRAKGSLMADWEAAWRTWIDGRSRFANARAGPGGHVNGKPKTNLRMDVILESIEDERNGIIYDQSLF